MWQVSTAVLQPSWDVATTDFVQLENKKKKNI